MSCDNSLLTFYWLWKLKHLTTLRPGSEWLDEIKLSPAFLPVSQRPLRQRSPGAQDPEHWAEAVLHPSRASLPLVDVLHLIQLTTQEAQDIKLPLLCARSPPESSRSRLAHWVSMLQAGPFQDLLILSPHNVWSCFDGQCQLGVPLWFSAKLGRGGGGVDLTCNLVTSCHRWSCRQNSIPQGNQTAHIHLCFLRSEDFKLVPSGRSSHYTAGGLCKVTFSTGNW